MKAVPPLDVESGGSDRSTPSTPNVFAHGLRVSFQDLTFSVPSHTEKGATAQLIKQVSGYFEASRMMALMGPSGSGKTTLLDVLAGRKSQGQIEGTVLFGGEKPSKEFLRRYTGYVEQFDTLIPTLTVYEMLLYTAELKRPLSEPLASKKQAVDDLLAKLALTGCKNVKIGSVMSKGISGGQSKRTNIGIALITNPRLLFLDEPTSGLDSYTANEVMAVVKALTKDGKTICATIHSPTSYCFDLFDSMMMLVRGSVVYFGEQGGPAIDYAVQAWTEVKAYKPGMNEAEWFVDLVTDADRNNKHMQLVEAYQKSDMKKSHDATLLAYSQESSSLPEKIRAELSVRHATVTPWWWGILTLLKYRTTKNYTDGNWMGPRIADKLLVSLVILTLYLGIGDNFAENNIVNLTSSLFMWCVLPAFGAASYVPALVMERPLFVRERSDGLYRVITYLSAKLIEEIFLSVIITLCISLYVYYGVQYQGSFLLFWLTYLLTLCNGIALAYTVAALSPNIDVANSALPAFVVIMLFFAGQLATFDNMPAYWKWFSYIDFLRYSWGAQMINQFQGRGEIFTSGLTVLQYYGLEGVNKWAYFGYLSCFFWFFAFCAWLILSLRRYQSR